MINYKISDYGVYKLYNLNKNNFISHCTGKYQITKFRILRLNNISMTIGFRLKIILNGI